MKKLILASASPGRKEALEKAGFQFEIIPSNYEEDMNQNLSPEDLVRVLSQGKARDVASKVKEGIVIGADTVGVFDGKVLGKPHTEEKNIEMLQELSGKSHSMLTGLTLIDSETGKEISRVVETKIWFKNLSLEEIENYVKTGEALQKAGGYAFQGIGRNLVNRVEGSETNIIGMPVETLQEMLTKLGFAIL